MHNHNNINPELHQDQSDFQLWQSQQHARLSKKAIENKKEQLRSLVKKVIDNELDDFQKQIVTLHWYNDLSIQDVAQTLNLSISTIYRHLEKINTVIYEKLKYALEYNFQSEDFKNRVHVIDSSCLHQDFLKCDDLNQRIKALRKYNFWDIPTLSQISNISAVRLNRLEKKLEIFTLEDVKKFSEIFKVSTDFLIFGNNRS